MLDYTNKLTIQLIKDNQTVLVEEFAVKNMVKNQKSTRAISEGNWAEIFRQLEYKAK